MPTALEMTPEELRKFNPSRNITAQRALNKYSAESREKALKVAKKAATLLRKKIGAKKRFSAFI